MRREGGPETHDAGQLGPGSAASLGRAAIHVGLGIVAVLRWREAQAGVRRRRGVEGAHAGAVVVDNGSGERGGTNRRRARNAATLGVGAQHLIRRHDAGGHGLHRHDADDGGLRNLVSCRRGRRHRGYGSLLGLEQEIVGAYTACAHH